MADLGNLLIKAEEQDDISVLSRYQQAGSFVFDNIDEGVTVMTPFPDLTLGEIKLDDEIFPVSDEEGITVLNSSHLKINSIFKSIIRDKYYEISGNIIESSPYSKWVIQITIEKTGVLINKSIVNGDSQSFTIQGIPTNDPCIVTIYPFIEGVWKKNTSYEKDDLVIDSINSSKVWICVESGISGNTEPIFNNAPISTIDNTVTWRQFSKIIKPSTNGPITPSEII